MKRFLYALVVFFVFSCSKNSVYSNDSFGVEGPVIKDYITKVTLKEEQKAILEEGNGFSSGLLRMAYDGENTVVSPLSLQMVLSMVVNGAEGNTSAEILRTLGYGSFGIEEVNDYCKAVLEQLPALDKGVVINNANAIIVDDSFKMLPEYSSLAKEYFYAPAESVSFKSGEAVKKINSWAKKNTNGQIDPFIESLPGNVVSLLLNAIYFKSKWADRNGESLFLTEDIIKEREFMTEKDGIARMDFLSTTAVVPYFENDYFQIVALPYSEGHFLLYAVLPKNVETESLSGLLDIMSESSFRLTDHPFISSKVSIKIPKFEICSSFDLTDVLKKMGIKDAFDKSKADFSNMYQTIYGTEMVWLGGVIQKSVIKISEWGTEAASVTAARMNQETSSGGNSTTPVLFDANHPFIFFLAEKDTGIILYEGAFTGVASGR